MCKYAVTAQRKHVFKLFLMDSLKGFKKLVELPVLSIYKIKIAFKTSNAHKSKSIT